jgi:hypothetical protein
MRANRDRLAVREAVALKHRKIILPTAGLNEPSGPHGALQEPAQVRHMQSAPGLAAGMHAPKKTGGPR